MHPAGIVFYEAAMQSLVGSHTLIQLAVGNTIGSALSFLDRPVSQMVVGGRRRFVKLWGNYSDPIWNVEEDLRLSSRHSIIR